MTNELWSVLIQHNINRKESLFEMAIDLVEYLAILVSPHPKETIKAIDSRRKTAERDKMIADGKADFDEKSGFVNTTFYDTIKEVAGDASVEEIRKSFEEKPADKVDSQLEHEITPEDIEFMERARRLQKEDQDKRKNLDVIEF
jgi:hypothetical protein